MANVVYSGVKADVWSLGVMLFMLLFGGWCFCWTRLPLSVLAHGDYLFVIQQRPRLKARRKLVKCTRPLYGTGCRRYFITGVSMAPSVHMHWISC